MFSERIAKKYKIENKIRLLRKISENREILFGALNSKNHKDVRCQKWMEVHEIAKSYNLIPQDKDWVYVRDVLWQNLKKTALGKKPGHFSEADKVVFDILKIDSKRIYHQPEHTAINSNYFNSALENCFNPVHQNLISSNPEICLYAKPENRSNSKQENSLSPLVIKEEPQYEIMDDTTRASFPEISQFLTKSIHPNDTNVKQTCEVNQNDSELVNLRKEKIRLQVEYLKLINYKAKLEILQLEQNLKFPRSEFTRELPTKEE